MMMRMNSPEGMLAVAFGAAVLALVFAGLKSRWGIRSRIRPGRR